MSERLSDDKIDEIILTAISDTFISMAQEIKERRAGDDMQNRPVTESNTERIAKSLIKMLRVHKEELAENGVRVALSHLNPNGFAAGMNIERELLFNDLITSYMSHGRNEEASGVREFREALRQCDSTKRESFANRIMGEFVPPIPPTQRKEE